MTESSKQNKLRLAKELSYDIRRTITDFLSENIKEEGVSKADWLLISNLGLIITSDYINKPFTKKSQASQTERYLKFLTEDNEDKNEMANGYSNLGSVYHGINDNDNALKYYERIQGLNKYICNNWLWKGKEAL